MNVKPTVASELIVGDDISYSGKIYEVIATDTKIVRLKQFKKGKVALRGFADKYDSLDGNLIVDLIHTGN